MFRTGRLLLAGTAAAGALAAYAFYVEPRWLEVTRTRVHVPRLPKRLEGLRIALVTDLHAGGGTPMWLVRRACRLAMQARPDLIAVTGDFVSADSKVTEADLTEALTGLHAPLGVYAVPGNHDHAHGIEAWHRAVAMRANLIDLTNTSRTVEHRDARIGVAGVDDFDTGDVDLGALHGIRDADLALLLAHNPDTAELLQNADVTIDLVLSGHTHGGQVRLPVAGALKNPAHFELLYEAGLQRRPWTQVYTSRGIGTVHLPVRLMCRPEVAVLELVASE